MKVLLRSCLALLAAGILLAPWPATAQATVRAPVNPHALTLAKIIHSEANIIGDEQDDEKALAFATELCGSKEDCASLESEHPGIWIEISRAIGPTINRYMRARLPDLWQRQAALYEANLTNEELDRLIAFYGSPTGQKMFVAMFRHIKPTAMMTEMKSSETITVSPEAVIKDGRRTVPDVMAEMNEADMAQLKATFSQPGLAHKMQQFGPKTQQIMLDWMDESAPGEDEAVEKIVTSVIERRQKKRDVK